ncbi:MAG: M20/M25/M40 family metallo-hydrolase [Candidatus Eisenbacteria bacterium]|uniref:M20/M25/M40 family metallo-hydrolase n=1 Tax=Eiseniibacteriota bacterium TaxID=2212470 RepID=A0A849SPW8_UNCEI|nr:M20/M25/M40 family metallo-hydrolase [Candidatus Eisenbacteria bacterium]
MLRSARGFSVRSCTRVSVVLLAMTLGATATRAHEADDSTPVTRAALPPPTIGPGLDPAVPVPARRAGLLIAADAIRGHIEILADDRFEGRETGTPGYQLAARYVAAQFRALGLEPADSSGYLQPIAFRRYSTVPSGCRLSITRAGREVTFRYREHWLASADPLREKWSVEAPMVFAGHGITAPEFGYDDYANLDVTGKIVVLLSGAPKSFPADPRAHYSSGLVRDRNAAAHGAVGIVSVRTPADELRSPWERSVRQADFSSMKWLDSGGAPTEVYPQLEFMARLSNAGGELLFEGARRTLAQVYAASDSGRAQGFPLAGTLNGRRVSALSSAASSNVVGVLPGSDPRLRGEYVVVSAHLDHLGIGAPVAGDSIHNGAYDNASGVAVMLEIARALRAGNARPKRSLVFVALTGEEKGLQGSDYFAKHPSVGEGHLVANLNLDMALFLAPLRSVVVFGGEHSSLGPVYERAARAADLEVSPDPAPEQVVFVRSDQYSFVKQGIPAAFPTAGSDGTDEGLERVREWRRTRYHSPQDDLNQNFDWPSAVRFARMNLFALWEVANAPAAPRWNAGDFFGDRFGTRK